METGGLSSVDEERAWTAEPAIRAFIAAEMRCFVEEKKREQEEEEQKELKRSPWLRVRSAEQEAEAAALAAFGSEAVDVICTTASAAHASARAEGLLAARHCLYSTLGLDRTASPSEDDMRTSYKKMTRKLHPDRFASASEAERSAAEATFKALGEAYEVLSDPQKRRRWDNGETADAFAKDAMPYLRAFFDGTALRTPLQRCGVSDEDVSRHIAQLCHHLAFRQSPHVRTIEPSGAGEAAARLALGLPPREERDPSASVDADSECEVWGPNGVCLQTKAEAEAWRKRRFEKVQIEGTRGLGHR